jgi:hypothetical protein
MSAFLKVTGSLFTLASARTAAVKSARERIMSCFADDVRS